MLGDAINLVIKDDKKLKSKSNAIKNIKKRSKSNLKRLNF